MSHETITTTHQSPASHPLFQRSILQRKCVSCGRHKIGGSTCTECQSGKQSEMNSKSPRIQAKLSVGRPHDKQEKEADWVAEQVMRIPAPSLHEWDAMKSNRFSSLQVPVLQKVPRDPPFNGKVINNLSTPVSAWSDDKDFYQIPARSRSDFEHDDVDFVQDQNRQWYKIGAMTTTVHTDGHVSPYVCRSYQPPSGECFPEHGVPTDGDAGVPMSKSLPHQSSHQNNLEAIPPVVYETLRSQGQPLESQTLRFMESRFARDFGHVQIHTGTEAATSALSINARAYTLGQHIVFGSNQYQPHTRTGQALIAHELTHVVQQQSSLTPPQLQRQVGSTSSPQRGLELRPSTNACGCLIFIHNDEQNARQAAEELHQNCRYNLAIIMPNRGGRRVPAVGVTRSDTEQRGDKLFVGDTEVQCRDGACTVDPNELFSPLIQEQCTRDTNSCRDYITQHNDFTAQQMRFFLTIRDCSNNFNLPTVALHNNRIQDTQSFRHGTSVESRNRLRGDFLREDVFLHREMNAEINPEGQERNELRQRLGIRSRIMDASGTTNIFRWCNLPEIGRCHVGNPERPDDVIWVTNITDFNTLRQQDVNVVLQEQTATTSGNESVTDLSTLFLRLGNGARYINIETPGSPRSRATRARNMTFIQSVLSHVGLDCCERSDEETNP